MSELEQADKDSMLLVEAFVLGQGDPSIWQQYMNGWASDVERRIHERFPNSPPRSPGPVSGTEPIPGTDPPAGN